EGSPSTLPLERLALAPGRRRAGGDRGGGQKPGRRRPGPPPLFVLGAFPAAFLRCGRTTRATRTRLRTFAGARAPRGAVAFCRAGLDVVFHAFARMPNALATLAFGDLGDRAAADHRQRLVLENVPLFRAAGLLVLRFDQKPRLLFLPGLAVHAHEMPSPMQLLAVQGESKMTFFVARVRVALRVPAAAVPDHDGTAAILSPR